jgi:hypothetical protein
VDRQREALIELVSCGPSGGQALADVIRRLRTTSDTVGLMRYLLLPMQNAVGQQRTVVVTPECEAAIRQVAQQGFATVENAVLSVLPHCGRAGARVTAAAITVSRTSHDTVALLRTYRHVDLWRDADVMQAALNVAGDAGASTQARVFALRHLLWLAQPGQEFAYGGLVAGNVAVQKDGQNVIQPACRRSMIASELPNASATPLPSDYLIRIHAAVSTIAASTSTPVALKNAAECLDPI